MMIQTVGGFPLRLKEKHNLDFIEQFGQVFNIGDEHTCGMLSFGITTNQGQRLYLKYAGARTINYPSDPAGVVKKLRIAAQNYTQLRHASLIKLIENIDFGNAFLCVFQWADGLPLGPEPEGYGSFRKLSLLKRLGLFDMICDFHLKAENMNIAIAGLYDAHMNFNPQREELLITNIDDYLALPCINTWGRLPGSALYLPPEGYQMAAAIDESSNVYTLGALSHSFFGNKINKKKESWGASDLLYTVANRALQENRNQRQACTEDFLNQWRDAVAHSRF